MKALLKTAEKIDPHVAHYELMQRHLMDNPPPDEDPGEQSRLERAKITLTGQDDPVRRYNMKDIDSDSLVDAASQSPEYGEEYLQATREGRHEDLPKTPFGQRK